MNTTTQTQLASNPNSHVASSGRQPWQTPKVIIGEMTDAEHASLIIADGGGGPGTSLS